MQRLDNGQVLQRYRLVLRGCTQVSGLNAAIVDWIEKVTSRVQVNARR